MRTSGGILMRSDNNIYFPFLAAPLATMAGWSIVFYSSVFIYEMLEKKWTQLKTTNFLVIGLIISLIALFRDLQIDPVATNLGLWTWHEILEPWYCGVPLVNFTAWLCAVFCFGASYTFIIRTKMSNGKKILAMFVMIPILLFLSGKMNFTLVGLIEGFDGPTWKLYELITK
ncbi:carotenoid biosynthesis protein [Sphingobacterium siyangense]|uniref:Uncharacterized protein DUF422 n=1 Tax=Sphingobacterium siyangense TaxID=459529 RepID=A0A562MKK5_9SPHI|nr:carotenoid biosynthesis protein [Sphingobacterium siyangense]TWI20368.1 uncharacterized protein DUF422 [Sphingobacterium siyangense]